LNQDTKIVIKDKVFIIPLISSFTKVVNMPINKKFGFYVHHTGTTTMLQFDTEEEANKAMEEIDLVTDEYWEKKTESISFNNNNKKKNRNKGKYLPPFLRNKDE